MAVVDTVSFAKDLLSFLQYPLTIGLFYLGLPRFAFTKGMLRAAEKAVTSFSESVASVTDINLRVTYEGKFLERMKLFASFEFGHPLGFSLSQIKDMTLSERVFFRFFVPIIDRRICQAVVVVSAMGACFCLALVNGHIAPEPKICQWIADLAWYFCYAGALLPLLFVAVGRIAEGRLVSQSQKHANGIANAISKKKQDEMRSLAVEVGADQPAVDVAKPPKKAR